MSMERKKKTKKGGPGKKEAAVTSGPGKETTNYFPDQEGAIQEEIRKHEEEAKENEPPKDQSIIQFSDQEFYALSFQAYRNSLERSSQLALPICKGYLNSGNTCFVNCVIQSILSLPRMIRFLLAFKEICTSPSQIPPSVSTWLILFRLSFGSFTAPLLIPSKSQQPRNRGTQKLVLSSDVAQCISPCWTEYLGPIVEIFRQDISPTASSSQADAMEFFTYLLDRLHEEMLSGQEALEVPFNRDDEFSVPCVAAEEEWEEVGRAGAVNHVDQVSRKNAVMLNNSTIISSIFHGTLRSEVKYPNKKATSISFQRFHCLSLDLTLPSPSTPSLDLQTAMDAYFAEEALSDVRMTKKVTLESIPPVLVLQLQRFTYHKLKQAIIKIQRDVNYPETFTLSRQYLSTTLVSSLFSPPTYQLQAIIMHHGDSADDGHYTALCRGEIPTATSAAAAGVNGKEIQWRHIDDTTITGMPKNQIFTATSQAYVLFYCRTADPVSPALAAAGVK